jgi:FkbM family methyltransferase
MTTSDDAIFSSGLIDVAAQLDLTMLDLGARDGFDAELISVARGVRAIGFEPEPQEAERLEKAIARPWRSVKMLSCAVGGQKGKAKLYIPPSPAGASLRPHNAEMLDEFGYESLHKTIATTDVDVLTLDDLLADGKIEKTQYLKIDIEGAELEVLAGGTRALEHCQAIKVEVSFLPQRVDQALAHEVAALLDARGFALADILDPHHWRRRPLPAHPYVVGFDVPYSRGRLAQADILFFRRYDTLPDHADLSALVLISAAMGYFDHAFTLLRRFPENVKWWSERGVNIEAELKAASGRYGRGQLKQAIQMNLRGLVPLLRSLLGGLPYNRPERPY